MGGKKLSGGPLHVAKPASLKDSVGNLAMGYAGILKMGLGGPGVAAPVAGLLMQSEPPKTLTGRQERVSSGNGVERAGDSTGRASAASSGISANGQLARQQYKGEHEVARGDDLAEHVIAGQARGQMASAGNKLQERSQLAVVGQQQLQVAGKPPLVTGAVTEATSRSVLEHGGTSELGAAVPLNGGSLNGNSNVSYRDKVGVPMIGFPTEQSYGSMGQGQAFAASLTEQPGSQGLPVSLVQQPSQDMRQFLDPNAREFTPSPSPCPSPQLPPHFVPLPPAPYPMDPQLAYAPGALEAGQLLYGEHFGPAILPAYANGASGPVGYPGMPGTPSPPPWEGSHMPAGMPAELAHHQARPAAVGPGVVMNGSGMPAMGSGGVPQVGSMGGMPMPPGYVMGPAFMHGGGGPMGPSVPSFAPPPVGGRDHISRTLLLSGIPTDIANEGLRIDLEQWGPIRHLSLERRVEGLALVSFFDLRHAKEALTAVQQQHLLQQQRVQQQLAAQQSPAAQHQGVPATQELNPSGPYSGPGDQFPPLQASGSNEPRRENGSGASSQGMAKHHAEEEAGKAAEGNHLSDAPLGGKGLIAGRAIWAQFTVPMGWPEEGPDAHNQGTLVVFNVDADMPLEDLRTVFEAYGDVKELRETPTKKQHKFVEFFDVRDATRAMLALDGKEIGGKRVKIEFSRPGGQARRVRQAGPQPVGMLPMAMGPPRMGPIPGQVAPGQPVFIGWSGPDGSLPSSGSGMGPPPPGPPPPGYMWVGPMPGPMGPMAPGAIPLNGGAFQGTVPPQQWNGQMAGSPYGPMAASLNPGAAMGADSRAGGYGRNGVTRSGSGAGPSGMGKPGAGPGGRAGFAERNRKRIVPNGSVPGGSPSGPGMDGANGQPGEGSHGNGDLRGQDSLRGGRAPHGKRDVLREASASHYVFNEDEAVSHPDASRTTLMIKNIPNKYSQGMLLALLDAHCQRCNAQSLAADDSPSAYDFVYLPIDFKNRCNLGYAFVNFTSAAATLKLYRAFHAQQWEAFNSRKICQVTYARVQGRAALEEHFRNSRFACDTDEYLPLVFSPPRNGDVCPSPIVVAGHLAGRQVGSSGPHGSPRRDLLMSLPLGQGAGHSSNLGHLQSAVAAGSQSEPKAQSQGWDHSQRRVNGSEVTTEGGLISDGQEDDEESIEGAPHEAAIAKVPHGAASMAEQGNCSGGGALLRRDTSDRSST